MVKLKYGSCLEMEKGLLFGQPFDYWIELNRQAETIQVVPIIKENAKLRAKVSYYEDKLAEMLMFKTVQDA